MHIRTACAEDFAKIKSLYHQVACHGEGIARLDSEITDEYVKNFIEMSLANGLILVVDHPDDAQHVIAEIHAYRPGIKVFDHVLSNLTIVVHPAYQGKKVGRTIFTIFLEEIALNHTNIGRVELMVRESNERAIALYQSLGFSIEGRMEMRVKTRLGSFEADIPMGWQNPNFDFD